MTQEEGDGKKASGGGAHGEDGAFTANGDAERQEECGGGEMEGQRKERARSPGEKTWAGGAGGSPGVAVAEGEKRSRVAQSRKEKRKVTKKAKRRDKKTAKRTRLKEGDGKDASGGGAHFGDGARTTGGGETRQEGGAGKGGSVGLRKEETGGSVRWKPYTRRKNSGAL